MLLLICGYADTPFPLADLVYKARADSSAWSS